MGLKEDIKNARKGNELALSSLVERYIKVYSYLSSEFPSYDCYKKSVGILVTTYIKNEDIKEKINDYFRNNLLSIIKNQAWDIKNTKEIVSPVSYLIEEARNGSITAKNKLIEHYAYLVDNIVDKYGFVMEEEDLRQSGYLFLIQKVTNYIYGEYSCTMCTYITNAINSVFIKNLLTQHESILEFDRIKNLKINPTFDPNKFELLKLEFFDFLEKQDIDDRERYIVLQTASGKTLEEIGSELGITESRVSKILIKARQTMYEFLKL